MFTHSIEIFDFFSQFTILAGYQSQAGEMMLSYFQGQNNVSEEEMLCERSATVLKNLLLQKRMGLFPREKKKYCIILTELCFSCQQSLLKIPRLCRIYNTPSITERLLPMAERANTVSQSLVHFCIPEKSSERFSAKNAESIMELCLSGLADCRAYPKESTCAGFTGVERLLYKDIVEEFSGYYSLSIQFTHWGLLFPL